MHSCATRRMTTRRLRKSWIVCSRRRASASAGRGTGSMSCGVMGTHDLHATILHLLGLDHEALTFNYAGRDFRLTNVSGKVARKPLHATSLYTGTQGTCQSDDILSDWGTDYYKTRII